jgi:OmpA-OmpF porin, OOP family
MTPRLFILLLIASLGSQVAAQKVLWANKVLESSSQYSEAGNANSRGQIQVLGSPSVMPGWGFTPCAWTPATADGANEEYIKVGFAEPIQVEQIVIHENSKPGGIDRILLFDEGGKNYVAYKNPAPGPSGKTDLSYFMIERTPYKVTALMVVLNTYAVEGEQEIDAIGISDNKDSIKVKVRLAAGLPMTGERENLGPNINSATDELCPTISPDGRLLLFTRQGHPENIPPVSNQDIYYAAINPDGSFSPAANIGEPLNNTENSSVTSITPDGQTLLLLNRYYPDGRMEKGVSMSVRTGEGWGFPQNLEVTDFYNDNIYGEYCLTATGKVLIMTVQRKDGLGSKDIYVSFRDDNGIWSAPKNCGPGINSGSGESSPFLAADGVTLYFSTDGRPGYGRKDMFLSRRLDDTWTNWSEPENLGPFLNTPGWDAYYSIPADGKYAYFVSYTGSLGAADIFRAKLPEALRPRPVVLVRGKVLNAKTNEPIGARISYESLVNGTEIGIANSNPKTGEYSIVLPAGEEYGFLAMSSDYIPVSENIDLTKLLEYKEITRDLRLVPIEKGATIRLNNIFFETGKFVLRKQSIRELDRLAKLLTERPTMAIEVSGHTDDVGTDESNMVLSRNRSKSVYDYLVTKGIEAARLTSKGYGETKPQLPNTNADNRQINRRVEFTITAI